MIEKTQVQATITESAQFLIEKLHITLVELTALPVSLLLEQRRAKFRNPGYVSLF